MGQVLYFLLVLLLTAAWSLGGSWLTLLFEAPMSDAQTELCLLAVAAGVLGWPYWLIEQYYAYYRGTGQTKLLDWDDWGIQAYGLCVVLGELPVLCVWAIGEVMKDLRF